MCVLVNHLDVLGRNNKTHGDLSLCFGLKHDSTFGNVCVFARTFSSLYIRGTVLGISLRFSITSRTQSQ